MNPEASSSALLRVASQLAHALSVLSVLLIPALSAFAQLAITEVMSDAAALHQGVPVVPGTDFWELTNFGPSPIDLSEYRFKDLGDFSTNLPPIFLGVTISPGESIVCIRATDPNPAESRRAFLSWWWGDRPPAGLKVIVYERGIGFNNGGEVVQLWRVEGTNGVLVDRAEFPAAQQGVTFTHDLLTGRFGELSELGGGAWRAASADDIGSPGKASGPAPIVILEHPEGQTACLGAPVALRVRAQGLPRPHYRWFRDGVPLAGRSTNTLLIPAVEERDAGDYSVEVSNGLQTLSSRTAVLTVRTRPGAPVVESPPSDLEVIRLQPALFEVGVCAYPAPSFQWSLDGHELPGETNRVYSLAVAVESHAGTYGVRIANSLGSVTVAATLKVSRKPDLRITEVMSSPSLNTTVPGHQDWWELTNFDTNKVDLFGYRWDDTLQPSLGGALPVNRHVVVEPGESVIFVEDMSRDAFIGWWGRDHLPAGLQVIFYSGNGLSSVADAITLVNRTAVDMRDFIDQVDWTLAPTGATQWFDREVAPYGEMSVDGEAGAFRAAESDDVGSPGWTPGHSPPLRLEVRLEGGHPRLSWSAEPDRGYSVLVCPDLSRGEWKLRRRVVTGSHLASFEDITAPASGATFYRVVTP